MNRLAEIKTLALMIIALLSLIVVAVYIWPFLLSTAKSLFGIIESNESNELPSGYTYPGQTYFPLEERNPPESAPPIGKCSDLKPQTVTAYNKYKNLIASAVDQSGLSSTLSGTGYDARALLAALITQESGANWDPRAVSQCGSAGLNQFIAKTAIAYGMDVAVKTGSDTRVFSDYQSYQAYVNKNNLWQTCNKQLCKVEVSPCNSCTKQYCDFENDERFKPEKSILASAKYLNSQIKYCEKELGTLSVKVGVAAYNSGNCKGEANKDYTKKILTVHYPSWLSCITAS